MLKLAPDVAQGQAEADRLLDAIIEAVWSAAPEHIQSDGMGLDNTTARAALAPLLEQVRHAEREACVAALEGLDRTGREWVNGSLWSNVFRDGIAAIRARGNG